MSRFTYLSSYFSKQRALPLHGNVLAKHLVSVNKQQAHLKKGHDVLPLAAAMLMGIGAFSSINAHAAEPTVLPTITAKPTPKKTQQADSYLTQKTQVGKLTQNVHDVPQAVTSVNAQLLDDQAVSSLKDAMHNVAGLTFNAAEGGRSGDNMMLRGFYTFGDMYLDGIRDTAQYNRETFNYEQIDVLRGSAAMLFGRGQAGGVINQVSKQPELHTEGEVSAKIGQYDTHELKYDHNLQLGDHEAVRVALMQREQGSFRENPVTHTQPEQNRLGAAISAGLGLGTANKWIFNHYFLRTRDIADYGLRFDSSTKRPTTQFPAYYFWGVGQNFDNSETHISTLSNQLVFDNGASLNTKLRYGAYDRAYWSTTPNATNPPNTVGGGLTRKTKNKTVSVQSDYHQNMSLWGLDHEILAGVEYLGEDNSRWTLRNLGTATNRFYDANQTTNRALTYDGQSYAVYAQNNIGITSNIDLLLGARRDEMRADYFTPGTITQNPAPTTPATLDRTRHLNYGEWSYRTGVSFKPTTEQHYYVSYSDSFSPTADLYQLDGANLPAETSQTLEIGSKWKLLDDQLAIRLAAYRAIKQWERNTDLESTASVLTRKRRTDGIEIEAMGDITDKLNIFSGIALMDATILEVAEGNLDANGNKVSADPRLKGQQARNAPKYTANAWLNYALTPALKMGIGAEAKGKRLVYQPSVVSGSTAANALFTSAGTFNPNTAPSYVRYDAMLEYTHKALQAQLNIKNLGNTVYWDEVYDNGGFTVPGTKRTTSITLKYKF